MLSKHLLACLTLLACQLPAKRYSQCCRVFTGIAWASAFYAAHNAAFKPVGRFIYL